MDLRQMQVIFICVISQLQQSVVGSAKNVSCSKTINSMNGLSVSYVGLPVNPGGEIREREPVVQVQPEGHSRLTQHLLDDDRPAKHTNLSNDSKNREVSLNSQSINYLPPKLLISPIKYTQVSRKSKIFNFYRFLSVHNNRS